MLKSGLVSDLKSAMKRGDAARVSVLRMALAALHNKEIEKRVEKLSDDEELQVLATEARKRKEAIEGYERGGRAELAEKERGELAVLKSYLPQEASEEEIRRAVKEAITKTGAVSPKDMGKVMGAAMASLKGRADGAMVQRTVKEELGA